MTRLIERHLSGLPGFPAKVRVETRLQFHSPGIYHDNYFFAVADRELLLRMAKRYRPQRTATESSAALDREAETLRVVARCGFAYPAPRLVCVVTDDGKTVGLIETCLDGAPLSASISADGDFRLRSCAEVAGQVHQLPVSAFSHPPACADSGSHIAVELQTLPPELFTTWPAAAAARDWITAHRTVRPAAVLHGDLLPQNLLWDLLAPAGSPSSIGNVPGSAIPPMTWPWSPVAPASRSGNPMACRV